MDGALDGLDGAMEVAAHELMEGAYASEDTLHSSVAFLRNTLTGLGFCQDLNLLSAQPCDVVSTCNTIYGLLLQHQKDTRFREQLKQDMHRLRLDVSAADKERGRLEGRLAYKEREIGGMVNKGKTAEEQHREELRAARREAEELQKKVTGCERRIVQLQHEMKRKEKEFERLQERLSHYLSDKKKNERAVLEMAGKLTQQLAAGGGSKGGATRAAAGGRSDEGLKAVVAAYEQKQEELGKENRDLKAALASLQGEYKEALNRQVRQQAADAHSSSADAAADDAFLQSLPSMSEEEVRAELSSRAKALQRRTAALPAQPASQAEVQATQSVMRDQERLLTAVLASLRASQKAKEAQHQADMRRMAQHYQGQLAAADQEIQKAKEAQAVAAQSEVDALKEQMVEIKAAVTARAQAEVAAARADAESAAAEQRSVLERQLAIAQAGAQEGQQRAAAATAEAQREREGREAAAEAEQGRRAELAAQQEEAAAAKRRFELMKKNYEALMKQYAPGVGAGVFLERAVSRKASELTDLQVQDSAAGQDTIRAQR